MPLDILYLPKGSSEKGTGESDEGWSEIISKWSTSEKPMEYDYELFRSDY
jgi:hypothetical protein